jgi:TatA/E family protein of Tat protein translocase
MGIENPVHLLFVAVVALLVLGPKRLPELARALGKGLREFRETMSGAPPAAGGASVRAPDPAPGPADPGSGADQNATVDPPEAIPSRDAPDRRPL